MLHLLNLSGTDPRPAHEFLPVGPLHVRVRALPGLRGASARLLVAGGAAGVSRQGDWLELTVDRIVDHEVVVIE